MAKYNAFELQTLLKKGQAMKNPAGDPSYPIADEEDLGNAIHAVGRGGASANAIRKYIMDRAKAMGKSSQIPDTWNADGSLSADGASTSSRAEMPFTRSYALDDVSVRAGGDGRTVEAYAAVFGSPAPVRDQDGEYEEVIDPAAFNKVIEESQRSGRRIPVMFNHGMTLFGTPSELDTMPIGVTEEIRADSKGLFTRAKYHKSDRADAVLEAIRDGSVSAYSFSGMFRRSDPQVPHGGFRRRGNRLSTVRRSESTLREYGPTPFPVYAGAEVVGVRAEQAALLIGTLHPTELDRLVGILQSGHQLPDVGAPLPGSAPEPPPPRQPARSPKAELQAQRARFIIRHGGDTNNA